MNKKILLQALSIARKGSHKHSQFDCKMHWSFIVQGGIVGSARNISAPPLIHKGYDSKQKRHSETEVYYNYRGKLDHTDSYDIINIRLNRRNELKLSYPCDTCWNFLLNTGCRMVYFSTPNGFAREKIHNGH